MSVAPDAALASARAALRGGGLVAYPTETLYGLGSKLDDAALARLYAAKGLPPDRTVSVLFVDFPAAQDYIHSTPLADALAAAFLPGPLTLVVEATDRIPRRILGGGPTVGVRVSPDPMACALAADGPITSTSANLHGRNAPETADEVRRLLGDRVDVVLDGGRRPGPGSTVVDATGTRPRILRVGMVPETEVVRIANALLP